MVIAREDRPGDRRLVGYVAGEVQADQLRARLAERLPDYMVPAAVVSVAALPLTVNGKLDKRALPAPDYTDTTRYRAPSTAVEGTLAGIYAQVLGLPRVGIDESFFDLGGNSLLAMRVVAGVRRSLNVDLTVRSLFDTPSVASLSQQLRQPTRSPEVTPVEVLRHGVGVPLFCIHTAVGLSWPYHALGAYLDCPIVGIQQVPDDGPGPSRFAAWRRPMPTLSSRCIPAGHITCSAGRSGGLWCMSLPSSFAGEAASSRGSSFSMRLRAPTK
ncbi:phosphopantetheine attachment site family protein [Mycobacterium kansasii 732]|nr:phosphopantetheine attachment site family protein [Mycobacterium kansasii 732]